MKSVMAYASRQGAIHGVAYSRTVTLAAPSSTLSNFPVMVRVLNDPTFAAHVASPYGYDVSFQTLGSTTLAYDLDYYDASTGSGCWWVQIPSLVSTAPATIKMLYGDASITTNQSQPATVWSEYSYIYHFPSVTSLASSVGSYTATFGGTVTAAKSIVSNSFTGRGLRLYVTSGYGGDYVNLALGNSISTSTGGITVMSQSNMVPVGDGRGTIMKTGWTQFGLNLRSSGYTMYAGNQSTTVSQSQTGGHYCYGASTSTSAVSWVVNGASLSTTSCTTGSLRWDSPAMTMTGYNASHPTEIILDEIRISSTTYHSAAWLLYEQNQMINHDTYTTYGQEQTGVRTRQ